MVLSVLLITSIIHPRLEIEKSTNGIAGIPHAFTVNLFERSFNSYMYLV